MAVKTKIGVYNVDGIVAEKDLVAFVSYLHELEEDDVEFTRLYMHKPISNKWGIRELEHELVSIESTRKGDSGSWHLLSKRGTHIQLTPGKQPPTEEIVITDAGTGQGKYGYVSQIRLIGEHLYVCGMCRQVYRFEKNQWKHIDKDILAPVEDTKTCFESIDGTSENDIYAVGWKGEIYHYNGKKWTKLDSPTNLDLNRVKCVKPDLVYICGDEGLVLQGSKNSWKVFQDSANEDDFWGVEYFDGQVYLAGIDGLRTFDGQDFADVKTGLKKKLDGYRLHANDGVLWSFGQDHLAYFDGKKWTYVENDDNKP